jgi:hypothetical protein
VRLELDEITGPLIQRVEELVRRAPNLEALIATMKGGASL